MDYNLEKFVEQAREVAAVKESKEMISKEDYIEQLRDAVGFLMTREGGVQRLYQQHTSEIEYIKEQIKKMQEYIKILESGQDEMVAIVLETYDKLGIMPKSPKYAPMSVANTRGSVNILDEDKVPFKYKKEKVTISIDKNQIYKDIKAGMDVPGVEIAPGKTVRGLK